MGVLLLEEGDEFRRQQVAEAGAGAVVVDGEVRLVAVQVAQRVRLVGQARPEHLAAVQLAGVHRAEDHVPPHVELEAR